MTTYTTNSDFSTDAASTAADGNPNTTAITGWTVREPVDASGGPNSVYTITSDAGAEGGKYCDWSETGWGDNDHIMAMDALGNFDATTADLDVLYRVRFVSTLSPFRSGGKVLWNGTGWYGLIINSTGTARMHYWQGISTFGNIGATISLPDAGSSALSADTWYWVRIHRTSAGAWSWKMWSGAVGDEPAGWAVGDGGSGGVSQTSVTQGYSGIGGYQGNSTVDFDWFSAGTGEAAPGPGGGGGGTTVNLSGVSATGAAGDFTVTGAASVTVTGASSTGVVGTMTATGAAIAAIVGVASTGAVGSPTVTGAASTALTGASATGSAGTLTATGAANITIAGVSSTGQVGSLTVTVGGAVTVGLTGVSATGRVGLPTVTGAASVNVTGASATGQPGTITATVGGTTVILTGAGATGRVGTLSITGAANIAMVGASATGAAGSLSVTIPGSEAHIAATITITPAIGGTLTLQPAIDGDITIN